MCTIFENGTTGTVSVWHFLFKYVCVSMCTSSKNGTSSTCTSFYSSWYRQGTHNRIQSTQAAHNSQSKESTKGTV